MRSTVVRSGPLNWAQQAQWWKYQTYPHAAYNNIRQSIRFADDKPTPRVISEALRVLIERHEALRTTFEIGSNGEPIQNVHYPGPIDVATYEVGSLQSAEQFEAELMRSFDIRMEWPLRAGSTVENGGVNQLILVMSHVAADGWSAAIISREITELVYALRDNREARLAAPGIHPLDLSAYERSSHVSRISKRALTYWQYQIRDAPGITFDKTIPPIVAFRWVTLQSDGAARALVSLASRTRTSPATVFSAIVHSLLSFLTGSSRSILRFVFSCRQLRFTTNMVGDLQRTLFATVDVSGNPSFAEIVRRTHQQYLVAYLNSQIDPMRLREIEAREAWDRGTFLRFGSVVNFMSCNSLLVEFAGRKERETTIKFGDDVDECKDQFGIDCVLRACLRDTSFEVEAMVNESVLSRQTAELFLTGIEILLVRLLADHELTLNEMAEMSGLSSAAQRRIPVTKEIQQVLMRHPSVSACGVFEEDDDEGQRQLAGYVTSTDTRLRPRDLRELAMSTIDCTARVSCPNLFVICPNRPAELNDPFQWRALKPSIAGDGREDLHKEPMGKTEKTFFRAVAAFHSKENISMSRTYLQNGCKLIRVPAILRLLAENGYIGLEPDNFVLPVSLSGLARRLSLGLSP